MNEDKKAKMFDDLSSILSALNYAAKTCQDTVRDIAMLVGKRGLLGFGDARAIAYFIANCNDALQNVQHAKRKILELEDETEKELPDYGKTMEKAVLHE